MPDRVQADGKSVLSPRGPGDQGPRSHAWDNGPFAALLLAHAPDPAALLSVADAWGRTAVHMAAAAGSARTLALMPLRCDAHLLAREALGRTPLHHAGAGGNVCIVQWPFVFNSGG